MTTAKMTLLKVAMIRFSGYEIGKPAPMYLNCPCGAKPCTDITTKKDVLCTCGKLYTYNGTVIN